VPEGAKSLALEATIQPSGQTLTDKDIESLSARIVAAAEKIGAKLRG
jgi:phenylalanyl-tRNA synthetase beta chain